MPAALCGSDRGLAYGTPTYSTTLSAPLNCVNPHRLTAAGELVRPVAVPTKRPLVLRGAAGRGLINHVVSVSPLPGSMGTPGPRCGLRCGCAPRLRGLRRRSRDRPPSSRVCPGGGGLLLCWKACVLADRAELESSRDGRAVLRARLIDLIDLLEHDGGDRSPRSDGTPRTTKAPP